MEACDFRHHHCCRPSGGVRARSSYLLCIFGDLSVTVASYTRLRGGARRQGGLSGLSPPLEVLQNHRAFLSKRLRDQLVSACRLRGFQTSGVFLTGSQNEVHKNVKPSKPTSRTKSPILPSGTYLL